MPQQTLLTLTQKILSDLDSDEVNSIHDTLEATQVANVIVTCFYDICAELDLSFNGDLRRLTQVADSDHPTLLKIPENVSSIEWIKYNTTELQYMAPADFLNMCDMRSEDVDNVVSWDYEDVEEETHPIKVYDDRPPVYWTSFDDEYIIVDSWDSDDESTIQANNTHVWCTGEPDLALDNTTVIPIPSNLTNYLHAMAEARCFAFQKQQSNPKSEQREGRQRIRSMRGKWRQQRQKYEGPDFGR